MTKQTARFASSQRSADSEPDLEGRDPSSLSRAAEIGFQESSNRRGFRFLLAYIGVQVLYIAFYLVAAEVSSVNYVPLLADCAMLGLHCVAAAIRFNPRFQERGVFKYFMTSALILDAVLFAIADPVVQSAIVEKLEAQALFDHLGGVPSNSPNSIPHPYKSNLFFQFHCLYMSLMVLSFFWAVVVMPACMLVYSVVIVLSYRASSNLYEKKGIDVMEYREEILIETALMWFTLLLGLLSRRSIDQAQRPLFLALESGKDEIIKEKVKRCNAEFQASGLQDRMAKVMRWTASEASIEVAHEAIVGDQTSRPSPSVISAPAGRTLCARRARKTKGDSTKDGGSGGGCAEGDCLPSTARVWIESKAMPQPLGAVEVGQRVLCYDSLLQGLKYANIHEVSSSQAQEGSEWVAVSLADGTRLDMTANHPVECFQESPESVASKWVTAGSMEAERDSIRVLKTQLVRVRSVQQHATAGDARHPGRAPPQWVDLRVQHPDRHTVFVAHNQHDAFMAVGTPHTTAPHSFSVQKTFVHVDPLRDDVSSDFSSVRHSRHTASAPDLQRLEEGQLAEAGSEGNDWRTDSSPEVSPRYPTEGKIKSGSRILLTLQRLVHECRQAQPEISRATPSPYDSAHSDSACSSGLGSQHLQRSKHSSAVDGKEKRAGGKRRERQREKRRVNVAEELL